MAASRRRRAAVAFGIACVLVPFASSIEATTDASVARRHALGRDDSPSSMMRTLQGDDDKKAAKKAAKEQ